jgi:hypothetical protein
MGKGRTHRFDRQQRFEDMTPAPQNDAASFYFDLRLMLPAGMTAHDVQMARQAVEHRLQRVLRKKDRIMWTADGVFVSIGTGHPARAAAAAERIHQDICKLLAGDTVNGGTRREAPGEPAAPYGQAPKPDDHRHLNR